MRRNDIRFILLKNEWCSRAKQSVTLPQHGPNSCLETYFQPGIRRQKIVDLEKKNRSQIFIRLLNKFHTIKPVIFEDYEWQSMRKLTNYRACWLMNQINCIYLCFYCLLKLLKIVISNWKLLKLKFVCVCVCVFSWQLTEINNEVKLQKFVQLNKINER